MLEPYYNNITKRLIKTQKLYFLDTGLCSWLTEWSSPETLEAGAMSGAIFETWIISELIKTYSHNGLKPPFYYYRDKDMRKIDLLIIQDGTIYPLEIKKTASPDRNSIRHFSALEKSGIPMGCGGVLCLSSDLLPFTNNYYAIPIRM